MVGSLLFVWRALIENIFVRWREYILTMIVFTIWLNGGSIKNDSFYGGKGGVYPMIHCECSVTQTVTLVLTT